MKQVYVPFLITITQGEKGQKGEPGPEGGQGPQVLLLLNTNNVIEINNRE